MIHVPEMYQVAEYRLAVHVVRPRKLLCVIAFTQVFSGVHARFGRM